MKHLVLLVPFIVTACAAAKSTMPAASPAPASTSTPRTMVFDVPNFIFQGADPSLPIITHNPSPDIKNLYINPGAILFHETQFHMFFNSFTSWPGIVKVGYMTSADGYHWQMVQDAPVFTTDQIPYGNGKADVSSVLVTEDGTWMMYFHTVGGGEIGRATSAYPLGLWAVDLQPVLKPTPEGWDRYELGWPSIVKDGGEYRMYYGAQTKDGYAIGFATSADGVVWKKYPNPVLTAEAEWEYNKVDRPRVTKSPDGYVMIYQAGTRIEERGLAISMDGIHWEKFSGNPIFTSAAFPIPNAKTWDTNLLYHEGMYYYFMELGTLNGTDLYLTLHDGSLIK